MYAAALGLPNAIKLLCSGGADVNLKDIDGNTALHTLMPMEVLNVLVFSKTMVLNSSIENLKGTLQLKSQD